MKKRVTTAILAALRHQQAFDYYYSLGHKRPISPVAKKFKVSNTAVRKWVNLFNWFERIKELDAKIAAEVDSNMVDAILELLWLSLGSESQG